jgi:hypothetical protein
VLFPTHVVQLRREMRPNAGEFGPRQFARGDRDRLRSGENQLPEAGEALLSRSTIRRRQPAGQREGTEVAPAGPFWEAEPERQAHLDQSCRSASPLRSRAPLIHGPSCRSERRHRIAVPRDCWAPRGLMSVGAMARLMPPKRAYETQALAPGRSTGVSRRRDTHYEPVSQEGRGA